MGYRRKQQTLRLDFTGELEGLRVELRQVSPAVMRRIVAAAEIVQDAPLIEQANRVLDLCDALGGLLVSWNYQDEDGNPVPPTAEALSKEDTSFVLALVYGWMDAVAVRAQQLTAAKDVDETTLPMQPVG